MEIKPLQILLMMLYIATFYTFTSLLLPPEILLTQHQVLKIPQILDLLPSFNQTNYADISKIREEYENKTPQNNLEAIDLPKHLQIQYPKGADSIFYPFFRTLDRMPNAKELIRILHYGDSQLEGDRISAGLRVRLQKNFGGCGTGFLALGKNLPSNDYQLQITSFWQDLAIWGGRYKRKNPKNYGILGRYAVFKEKAEIKITLNSYATQNARNAQSLKIFYGNLARSTQASVQFDQNALQEQVFSPTEKMGFIHFPMPTEWQSWSFSLQTQSDFEIYGIAMDCPSGIAVDNIAFRGSSGTEFSRLSGELLAEQARFLQVKFIILQFGVNIVPYIQKDYSYFEQEFYEQLVFLKKNLPDIPILVVGVSDMARKENGVYVSYPNITQIRDAQRNAAFSAGCAFWDLYEAMGGENSIPSWVKASPPLASPDYTHFTAQGSDIVAEMLYEAILYDYQRFQKIPF